MGMFWGCTQEIVEGVGINGPEFGVGYTVQVPAQRVELTPIEPVQTVYGKNGEIWRKVDVVPHIQRATVWHRVQ